MDPKRCGTPPAITTSMSYPRVSGIYPHHMRAENVKAEVFRQEELDRIMKEHRAQPAKVQEFKRTIEKK